MLKIVIIASFLIASLVVYDLSIGKKSSPATFTAPDIFCSQSWAGITIPPVGIFICPKYKDDKGVARHELAHWDQYHRMGTLSFYGNYIGGWMMAGFNYENNWMEKEANEKEKGAAL